MHKDKELSVELTAELDDPRGAGAHNPEERARVRASCPLEEGRAAYPDYWAFMAPPMNVGRVLLCAKHQLHLCPYLGPERRAERGRGRCSVVHVC